MGTVYLSYQALENITDAYDLSVYLCILKHRKNSIIGCCDLSYNTIARETKISRSKVIKVIKNLCSHSFITKELQTDVHSGHSSNRYFIHDSQDFWKRSLVDKRAFLSQRPLPLDNWKEKVRFVSVEDWVLDLTPRKKAAYIALLKYKNKADNSAYPAIQTLAKALSWAQNTVRKYLQQLKKDNSIDIKPGGFSSPGHRKSNTYYFLHKKNEPPKKEKSKKTDTAAKEMKLPAASSVVPATVSPTVPDAASFFNGGAELGEEEVWALARTVITQTLSLPDTGSIRILNGVYSVKNVKDTLKDLKEADIYYAVKQYLKSEEPIKNPDAYILPILYNSHRQRKAEEGRMANRGYHHAMD